jgi:hypothetical protein
MHDSYKLKVNPSATLRANSLNLKVNPSAKLRASSEQYVARSESMIFG